MRGEDVRFPFQTVANDGGATPHPLGSEALRFVCLSYIARPESQRGVPGFSQDVFSEGVLDRCFRSSTCFFKAQPRFCRNRSPSENIWRVRSHAYRQARLNSRNLKIIATRLHIVNRDSRHLTRAGSRSRVSGNTSRPGLRLLTADLTWVRATGHWPCPNSRCLLH